MKYATFLSRFLASLIDGIIVYILSFLAGAIVGFFFGVMTGGSEGAGILGAIVGTVISWLYYALLESSEKQATLGKQALGIVVTDLNGSPISFARATGRYFAKYLSAIILLIGYIMAAFTEKKQALHDMIAGTLVMSNK